MTGRRAQTWGVPAPMAGGAWVAVFLSPLGRPYRRRVVVGAGATREEATEAAWRDRRERGKACRGWTLAAMHKCGVKRDGGEVEREVAAIAIAQVQRRPVPRPR